MSTDFFQNGKPDLYGMNTFTCISKFATKLNERENKLKKKF